MIRMVDISVRLGIGVLPGPAVIPDNVVFYRLFAHKGRGAGIKKGRVPGLLDQIASRYARHAGGERARPARKSLFV
jgi:hypothetical protein